ncbi:MAG: hypothetical protein ACQERO_01225 [Bacteroidota bacterium]
MKTDNAAFGVQALRVIIDRSGAEPLQVKTIEGDHVLNPVDEAPELNTTDSAQWSLNAIEIMAMCPEVLPCDMPEVSSHHHFRHYSPGGSVGD